MDNTASAPGTPTLVDVRSLGEYQSGHVDGAVHLPLERLLDDAPALLPDRSAELLLYCLSGARSQMAVQWLQQMGYARARNGGSVGMVALQTGRTICRNVR
ncbi:rhodanese-like domain-containing protein [Comamonas granuli]|uniref:rhodanese-like domain-containing protein n=1 Tax=Comamonas granuli TaxID=290309 RepID=UPI0005A5EF34|nr:rhodanese-like domain-containing protein [Comamonas granuli]